MFESLLEGDAELAAGWTFDNVNLGSLESVWSWKVYNNAGYLNGSGFANGSAVATEAYAISPVIDLSTATSPVANFQHAAKFQTTLLSLCGLYARVEGTTAWTKLTIPTWPAAGAWTFVNSGNVDLSAYAGKKIQLAFKYGSSADGADTWEIKNLKVIANGTPDQGGEDPNPPTPPTPPVTGDGVTVTGNDIAGCVSGAVTVDGYTFTASKESGTTAPAANVYNDETTIRLYADNTFTISGAAMAKIVFTLNTGTGSKRYTTFTPNTGSVAEQKADDTAITWSGDATSVTFTVGHDATLGSEGATKRGQVHISGIEIYPAN